MSIGHLYGGFLKCWVSPTTMGFPTKNDQHLGRFGGYHYLRKHPYIYIYMYYINVYIYVYIISTPSNFSLTPLRKPTEKKQPPNEAKGLPLPNCERLLKLRWSCVPTSVPRNTLGKQGRRKGGENSPRLWEQDVGIYTTCSTHMRTEI